jgi:hypothetical protein
MVHDGMDWFLDEWPFIYYSIGFVLLIVLGLASGIVPDYTAKMSAKSHFGLLVLMIIFLRIPSIGFNEELNPDESQMMAQAITLRQKPIFWASVDGTTSGPLNSYALLLPAVLGLPLDYTAARITALVLILVAFYFFYRSLQLISTPIVTRLSALAVAVFFGWTTWSDFLHYSSELAALPLLTACFYIACRWMSGAKRSPIDLYLMGFMAGLVPFCKLQALPVIVGPLMVLGFFLLRSQRPNYRALFTLMGGGVSSIGIILMLCAHYGVLDDFYTYYLLANLIGYEELNQYSTMLPHTLWERFIALPTYLVHHLDILALFALIVPLSLLRFLKVNPFVNKTGDYQWIAVMAAVTLGLSLLAVFKPETQFSHYLLFAVFPLGWMFSVCLSPLLKENGSPENRWPTGVFMATIFFFIFLRFTLYGYFSTYSVALVTYPPMSNNDVGSGASVAFRINPYLAVFPRYVRLQQSAVAEWIQQATKPTDCIAVWGWNCRLYVESQRRQGTAETHSQRSIMKNSFQAMYLEKYIRNLQENQPALFLDAVGPNNLMFTLKSQRHESYQALNRMVARDYSFVKEIDSIRIYRRKDLIFRAPAQVFLSGH